LSFLISLIILQVEPNLIRDLETRIRFQTLSPAEAVRGGDITCVARDPTGYLWFSDTRGVYRYDGLRVETLHRLASGSTRGRVMATDPTGRMWVGIGSRLYYHEPERATLRPVDWQGHGEITALSADPASGLVLGSSDGILSHYETSEPGRPVDLGTVTLEGAISGMVADQAGGWWVGSDQGLYRGVRTGSVADAEMVSAEPVLALCPDHDGGVWVGSETGVARFRRDGDMTLFGLRAGARASGITALTPLGEDLWIGAKNGLYRLQPSTGEVRRFTQETHGLSTDWVTALWVDEDETLWIGTGLGIQMVSAASRAIGFLGPREGDRVGFSHAAIMDLHEGRNGLLWIATFGGGLNRLDRSSGSVTWYRHDPETAGSLSDDHVISLFEDRDGFIWVGTFGQGLDRLDPVSGVFTNYRANGTGGLQSDFVRSITGDSRGGLWVGTQDGGLAVIDPGDPVPRAIDHGSGRLDVRYLTVSRSGHLWLGTGRGSLIRLDPDATRIDPGDSFLPDGFGGAVLCITELRDGTLAIGTSGAGFFLVDVETGGQRRLTSRDGLSNDTVHGILEDPEGGLWISTHDGLSLFQAAGRRFVNYGIGDGLENSEYNFNSHLATSDGLFLFGGVGGLEYFRPESLRSAVPRLRTPVLSSLRIDDRAVVPGEAIEGVTLRSSIETAERLVVDHTHHRISLAPASLACRQPERVTLAFRLRGLSDSWTTMRPNEPVATFTGLRAGEYSFEVKASSVFGEWSPPRRLTIRVLPPPWATWWARSIYGLLGCLLILVLLRYQKARVEARQASTLKHKNAELERVNEQLMRHQSQLLVQEKMASMGIISAGIAHEIRNPLNFILNFSEAGRDLIEEAGPLIKQQPLDPDALEEILTSLTGNLEIIERNGRRMEKVVHQLLEITSRKASFRREVALNPMVEAWTRFALSAHDHRGQVTMYHDLDAAIDRVPLVSQNIARVLLNIVANASEALEGVPGAEIVVATRKGEGHVAIHIKNNGPSIPDAHLPEIFFPFFTTKPPGRGHVGLGLSVCFDIIHKEHGGEITVASDSAQTTFTIVLPDPRASSKMVAR